MKRLIAAAALLALPAPLVAAPPQAPPAPTQPTAASLDLRYRCIGPSRGGRVTAVAGVAQRPGEFYFGASGGGVWKSTNHGETWRAVSDDAFATGSIGAIRAAPSDPDVVYVGTGSDGLRSNVITGRGVYRSTDAGRNWTFCGLRDVGQIGAVEVHPDDPDVAFVAAIGDAFRATPERGVYRTRDGGDTWEQVLFVTNEIGAVDLELAPDDPDTIYACTWRAERKPWTIISGGPVGGVMKSTDGGDTWAPCTEGLPTGLIGKSDLAVSPADPDRLYVLMEASDGDGGLYRSDDRGATFECVSQRRGLLNRPFYYTNVDADPSDADVVYVNNERLYKSTDGGEKWRTLRTPHGDNHDIWIHPGDAELLVQGNDGGANVSRDGGETWSTQDNQPTAEIYQVAVDDRFPYWVYGGQQDNSTIRVPAGRVPGYRPGQWQSVGGCETGPAIPKPGDPDVVYANCKGRFGVYRARTGQEQQYYVGAESLYGHNPRELKYRFQRVAPIHVSPHDANVVYHASQFLHRTTDEGVTWETISPDLTANEPDKQVISGAPITRDITGEEFYSTIYAVAESPLQPGLIWVGANDGPVHVTRDGGATWRNVTPDLPPGGRVQTVEPSPHRPGKAYVAVLRYQLGDWRPHLYRTEDYGASWTRLCNGANGIPDDSPTRVVREDPRREGLLFAGTEFGMWVSLDDGGAWQSLQLDLPHVPVTDLKVHGNDLVLSTMGRSFWVLHDVTPLRQLGGEVTTARLMAPAPAVRMASGGFSGFFNFGRGRRGGRTGAPGVPTYPPTGAALDYWLADAADGASLEVLDAEGSVVRRFAAGTAAPKKDGDDQEKGGGDDETEEAGGAGAFARFARRIGGSARGGLKLTSGHHRLMWDLRRSAPEGGGRRSWRGGARVAPGTYRVRLTVDGATQEQPLEVLLDPRLAREGITAADLSAQAELLKELDALRGRARRTADRVEQAIETLEDRAEGDAATANTAAAAELAAIEAELVTERGTYMPDQLQDQIGYLRSMVSGADQRPGRDAFQRTAELETELDQLVERLSQILVDAGLEVVR
ncbi:MAG: hypothetical protein AAF628_28980 [Planctomycetota bacterium]